MSFSESRSRLLVTVLWLPSLEYFSGSPGHYRGTVVAVLADLVTSDCLYEQWASAAREGAPCPLQDPAINLQAAQLEAQNKDSSCRRAQPAVEAWDREGKELQSSRRLQFKLQSSSFTKQESLAFFLPEYLVQ
jgi:hypothetical protein